MMVLDPPSSSPHPIGFARLRLPLRPLQALMGAALSTSLLLLGGGCQGAPQSRTPLAVAAQARSEQIDSGESPATIRDLILALLAGHEEVSGLIAEAEPERGAADCVDRSAEDPSPQDRVEEPLTPSVAENPSGLVSAGTSPDPAPEIDPMSSNSTASPDAGETVGGDAPSCPEGTALYRGQCIPESWAAWLNIQGSSPARWGAPQPGA